MKTQDEYTMFGRNPEVHSMFSRMHSEFEAIYDCYVQSGYTMVDQRSDGMESSMLAFIENQFVSVKQEGGVRI